MCVCACVLCGILYVHGLVGRWLGGGLGPLFNQILNKYKSIYSIRPQTPKVICEHMDGLRLRFRFTGSIKKDAAGRPHIVCVLLLHKI
jgi:hypothetical protein